MISGIPRVSVYEANDQHFVHDSVESVGTGCHQLLLSEK
jgi:hypothetical protein